ncbi:MAG TPA: hypothetical protein VIY48_03060 [Candidatus Paceibacterota bacterium]
MSETIKVKFDDFAYGKLEQENADLRAQLAAATKRIEEAEKQEPVDYFCNATRFKADALGCIKAWPELAGRWVALVPAEDDCHLRYTRPIPPADVAELQQQATDWRKKYEKEFARCNAWIKDYGEACQQLNGRIAELERKLAEQQAFTDSLQDFAIWMTGCGYDFTQHTFFVANRERLLAGKPDASELKSVVDCELHKLISEAREEGRKEAVPAAVVAGALYDLMGWLTTRHTAITLSATHDSGIAVTTLLDFAQMRGLRMTDAYVNEWTIMLAAAPSPALNAKEGVE